MANSPQNAYARNLSSHLGYPLRTPEPNIDLLDSYRREGLRIGDVGVVVPDEGSFEVFFNITLPQEHPLHLADGVPENFTQVQLRHGDYRIVPGASPGRVISPSTVECAVNCVDPFSVDGAVRGRLTDYQFSLHRNEGAMLILPQGTESHGLVKDSLFLDAIFQSAVDWYRFAQEELGQSISHDSLYLITGFHKARSWSLATFENTRASSARCKIVQLKEGGPILSDYCGWEATHSLDWRTGPRYSVEVPNQSVFIVGFKIAVNKELLSTRQIGASATTRVDSSASLTNPSAICEARHFPDGATEGEESNETLERDSQVVQPFHPSDIINRYMLKKEPSTKIAVTHDNQWIALLEEGTLQPQDMLQEGRLEAAVSQKYNIVTKDGAAYLQGIEPREPIDASTATAVANDLSTKHSCFRRHIIFFGETGAGKSSAINLLLETGTTATTSADSRPCTKDSASYETTLNGTKYKLWDTRGLGKSRGFLETIFGGGPEKDLKKFLKERHTRHEIDLLVYCVHGARAIGASVKHYNNFCAISRRLAAPVVIVVTHIERGMEEWWSKNSSELGELGMIFDDYTCINPLPGHPLRAESRRRLVDLITKDRYWEAKQIGSYFGSPPQKPTPSAPSRKRWFSVLSKAIGKSNVNVNGLGRHCSHRSRSHSRGPSSSYHTAGSPAESIPPSPVVEPPSPGSTNTSIAVPPIDTDLLQAGDRPRLPSEETHSSMGDSMFYHNTNSSHTMYSEVYLESFAPETEEYCGDLPFRLSTDKVRRRKSWANSCGTFGDVWECDLISGQSSRTVAVKAMKTNIRGDGEMRYREEKLRKELKVWGGLQHKHIVPLLGTVPGFGPLPSIVSPWYRNGSLSCYLAAHQLSGARKHRLLGDVAVGLQYLHSQGVVHGDLHSGNVLIDDDGTACITDFVVSFFSDSVGMSHLNSAVCAGVRFADPILVRRVSSSEDNAVYPTKHSDIYSYGGLMLHVLSGKKPFDGISPHVMFLAILKGEHAQIPTHEHISRWHKALIERCWDHDESKRPLTEDLVRMLDRQ